MGKMSRVGNDLYTGERSFDFVGRRGVFYAISILIVGIAIAALFVRPLNFGVEFVGGSEFKIALQTSQVTQGNVDKLRDELTGSGIDAAEDPTVTTAGNSIVAQTETVSEAEENEVRKVIDSVFPGLAAKAVSFQEVGPSWGQEVAKQAIIGIGIFLVLVVLFIWGYFREWKMSVAALIALFHDIAITVGVYALVGFPVTPAAVTGLLAILGFSLYDTVVVFDKIRENTTTLRKNTQSYADAANLAVNQTLVRSINTSIIALIPIGSILVITELYLGSSTLQDLALAQFVGMAAGVYSSVMLAPRVLVQMKSSETEVQEQARRARAKAKAKQADRYAAVPAFADDMQVPDKTPELDLADDEEPVDAEDDVPTPREARTPAAGKGRTAPTQTRKVAESGSSGRKQPERRPRSQRGKK